MAKEVEAAVGRANAVIDQQYQLALEEYNNNVLQEETIRTLKDKQNLSDFVLLVDTECDKCDGNKSRVFSFGEKNHSFELKELYSTTSGDNELLQYVGISFGWWNVIFPESPSGTFRYKTPE